MTLAGVLARFGEGREVLGSAHDLHRASLVPAPFLDDDVGRLSELAGLEERAVEKASAIIEDILPVD